MTAAATDDRCRHHARRRLERNLGPRLKVDEGNDEKKKTKANATFTDRKRVYFYTGNTRRNKLLTTDDLHDNRIYTLPRMEYYLSSDPLFDFFSPRLLLLMLSLLYHVRSRLVWCARVIGIPVRSVSVGGVRFFFHLLYCFLFFLFFHVTRVAPPLPPRHAMVVVIVVIT